MLLYADIVLVPTSISDDDLYRLSKLTKEPIPLYPFKKQLNCAFYYYNTKHDHRFLPFKATENWLYFIKRELAAELNLKQVDGYIENIQNIENICLNNDYEITKISEK